MWIEVGQVNYIEGTFDKLDQLGESGSLSRDVARIDQRQTDSPGLLGPVMGHIAGDQNRGSGGGCGLYETRPAPGNNRDSLPLGIRLSCSAASRISQPGCHSQLH